MADYRAISTGNYSDLARWEVWNGSAWVAATQLPTIADDVYANSYTVTIDVDSFASSYRTTGISGVAASGKFVLNGGITATGDVYAGGSRCLEHSDAADSYVIGDSYGSLEVGANKNRCGCSSYSTGTLHVIGDAYNGGGTASTLSEGNHGVQGIGSGSFVLYGNANGDRITSGNTGLHCGAFSLAPVRGLVYGRATGRIGSTAYGGKYGAFYCIVGECASYNLDVIVTSKFIMPATNSPQGWVNCFAKAGAPVQIEIYDELGAAVLCNPLFAQDQADEADVRAGTVYANGALTGTLAVPPAGSVSLGVPVDNTTGTGSVSSAEIRDLILPSILSAITQP